MRKDVWDKKVEAYGKLVAKAGLERKGKTVPYTSANGYMFSMVNKDGEMGIRMSKESGKKFMDKHKATIFKSHGATMRDYVRIPDKLLKNQRLIVSALKEGHKHVMSLESK